MESKRTTVLILSLIVALFFSTGSALALTTGSGAFNTDFRFNNPGARALGMGGAFIGVADDATAAFTNPAGLTILTKPELAAELKYTQYKNTGRTAVMTGGGGGVPSGAFWESTTTNDVSGLSFLSFAYPTEKATFTLFRHALVNLNTKIPPFRSDWSGNITYKSTVDTYGIAAGIKIVEGFSLGLNVGFSSMDSYTILPSSADYFKTTDSKVHGSVGLFYNPFGEFNVGAVYRYGPEFKFPYSVAGGAAYEDNLKIPDAYGLGLSYRFFNALTLAADINYIRYSQMMKDFRLVDTAVSASDYKMDDAIEVSAGLEYAFPVASIPVAVRGGYHYLPFHERYYDGSNAIYRALLPEEKDEHSFSVGIGAVLEKNIQVDFAGSWSDMKQDYILSLVYRF